MIIALIGVSVIYFGVVGGFLYVSLSPDLNRRLIYKCSVSVLFLAVSVVSYQYNQSESYFSYIFLALLCSFFGDLFLGAKHLLDVNRYMKLGIVAFLIAQCIYTYTFISMMEINVWLFLGVALFELLLFQLPLDRVMEFTKHKSLIIVYCFIVTVMMLSAWNVMMVKGVSLFSILLGMAGFLFYLSDGLLLWKYFGKRTFQFVGIMSSLFYFVAQYLFAISVAFYVFV